MIYDRQYLFLPLKPEFAFKSQKMILALRRNYIKVHKELNFNKIHFVKPGAMVPLAINPAGRTKKVLFGVN